MRRLDFLYKKRTKNSIQNIKNPNLTRTGIFGNLPDQLGLTDWFVSVPPSECCQLSVSFCNFSDQLGLTDWFVSVLQSEHCQLSGKFSYQLGLIDQINSSVRNDYAASVSDLVFPPQVTYKLGLRRFLYQNQLFQRDAQLSCWNSFHKRPS